MVHHVGHHLKSELGPATVAGAVQPDHQSHAGQRYLLADLDPGHVFEAHSIGRPDRTRQSQPAQQQGQQPSSPVFDDSPVHTQKIQFITRVKMPGLEPWVRVPLPVYSMCRSPMLEESTVFPRLMKAGFTEPLR